MKKYIKYGLLSLVLILFVFYAIAVPTTGPDLNKPDNNTIFNVIPELNWSNVTTVDLDAITYYLEVDNNLDFSSPTYVNASISETTNTTGDTPSGLSDATYYWRVLASNSTDNSSWSATWQFLLDTTYPLLYIDSPTNTTYTNESIDLNYSITETNSDTTWYTNDSGVSNYTLTSNLSLAVWNENSNTITLYSNDSANNENSTSVTLLVDTTYSLIDYSPETYENNSYRSDDSIYLNWTFTETNLDSIEVFLYNETDLINKTQFTSSTLEINFTDLNNETYEYYVYINDTAGNSNTTSNRTLTLDKITPTITLNYPLAGIQFTQDSLEFAYTPYDSYLSNCSLNLNNVATANTTITNGTEVYFVHSITSEGLKEYNISCIDSANNIGYSETRFITKTGSPEAGGGGGGSTKISLYDIKVDTNAKWFGTEAIYIKNYDANGNIIIVDNITFTFDNKTYSPELTDNNIYRLEIEVDVPLGVYLFSVKSELNSVTLEKYFEIEVVKEDIFKNVSKTINELIKQNIKSSYFKLISLLVGIVFIGFSVPRKGKRLNAYLLISGIVVLILGFLDLILKYGK